MSNYSFLDAYASVKTAASSTIGGVEYPIVKIPDTVTVSVLGTMPVTQTTTPWIVTGSVQSSPVANQSVSGTVGSSIIGTVPVIQSGTHIASISGTVTVASLVGTYPEGSVHGLTDQGLFALGVRNDTLASVVASDTQYSRLTVGPAGEVIMANAPLTKWVQGNASCFTGVIQPVIAAQGSSVFTYVTAVQVANASANNVYLTFYGASSSVVGYLPVPANSGAIPTMPNGWKSNANGAISASVSGVASVFISAQGFISKT